MAINFNHVTNDIAASSGTMTIDGAAVGGTPTAAQGASIVLLSTVSASAAATADVETTFNSTYDSYLIVCTGLIGSAGIVTINSLLKISGTYLTTSTYQWHNTHVASTASTYSGENGANSAFIQIGYLDGTAGSATNFDFRIGDVHSTTKSKACFWTGGAFTATANGTYLIAGGGSNTGTGAVTGVRFQPSSGTFTGTFRLYGLKNS